MSLQTFVDFQNRLAKVGISESLADVQKLLEATSLYLQLFLAPQYRLGNNQTDFSLTYKNILELDFKVYRFTSSPYELIPENQLTVETYSDTLVQTADVAVDYYNGNLYFAEDVGENNTLVVFRTPDFNEAFTEAIYSATLKDPVKEVTKGNITIKADSPLDVAIKMQKLKALAGNDVNNISTPRYSTGITKGRGRNVQP